MSGSKRHRSRNREETWREEELQKTLDDINRDLKKRHTPSSSHHRTADEKERESKHRSERHRENKDKDSKGEEKRRQSIKDTDDYSKSRKDSEQRSRTQKTENYSKQEKEPDRIRSHKSDEYGSDDRTRKKERNPDKDKERNKEKHHKREKDEEYYKDYSKENGRREKEESRERRHRKAVKEDAFDKEYIGLEEERRNGSKSKSSSDHRRGSDQFERKKTYSQSDRYKEQSNSLPKKTQIDDTNYSRKKDVDYEEETYDDDFETYEDDFDEDVQETEQKVTLPLKEKVKMEPVPTSKSHKWSTSSEDDDYEQVDIGDRISDSRNFHGAFAEDKLVSTAGSEMSKPQQHATPKVTMAGIRFTASTFRNPAARRQWQRAEDVRRLVDFDFVDFPLFEMLPVDEYSRYISSFGHSGRSQATTQTQEDRLEREMQTEEIEMVYGKWTQHPPVGDFESASGVDAIAPQTRRSHLTKESSKSVQSSDLVTTMTDFSLFQKRSDPLSDALIKEDRASHLPLSYCVTAILNILEEEALPQVSLSKNSRRSSSSRKNRPEVDTPVKGSSSSNLHFSDGYTEISLRNSHVPSVSLPCVDAIIASGDSNYLLTVHDVSESTRFQRHVKSLLFLWRVPAVTAGGPTRGPQECFYTAQPVTSVQLSPDPFVNHVIAGLHDGSLLLWSRNTLLGAITLSSLDSQSNSLRTLLRPHLQKNQANNDRHDNQDASLWDIDTVHLHNVPCYNTAALLALGRNEQPHVSPIVHLSIIHFQTHSTTKRVVSYHVASMDSQGTICLWIVNKLADRADQIGSEADPALTAGSTWSLALLTELRLNVELPLEMKNDILDGGGDVRINHSSKGMSRKATLSLLNGLIECRTFTHKHGDTSRFFIGCVDGAILQQCRGTKQTVYPHEFSTGFGDTSSVTSLSFYPFQEDVFLAGYDNGSICLYHTTTSEPIHIWPNIAPCSIQKVAWSQSCPNIFFALDDSGMFYTWNLLQDRFRPLKSEKVQLSPFDDEESSKSGSMKSHVRGFNLNGDYRAGTSGVKSVISPQIVLWSRETIQVHHLTPPMSQPELDDSFKMAVVFMDLL